MGGAPAVTLAVQEPFDVQRAQRLARGVAEAAGLGPIESESFVLAVMELGTNLVRYAHGGALRLAVVEEAGTPGAEVESTDLGPGIPSLGLALTDGYSTGGGLGSGLPAVRRLMDAFDITSDERHGTCVRARKWRRVR